MTTTDTPTDLTPHELGCTVASPCSECRPPAPQPLPADEDPRNRVQQRADDARRALLGYIAANPKTSPYAMALGMLQAWVDPNPLFSEPGLARATSDGIDQALAIWREQTR